MRHFVVSLLLLSVLGCGGAVGSNSTRIGRARLALEEAQDSYESGACTNAIRSYDEALRLEPELADKHVYFNRASCYHSLGQRDRELADLTEALRMAPRWKPALFNRAACYAELGKSKLAIADYTDAIGIDSRHSSSCYAARADQYQLLGKHKEAISDCNEAIRLEPKNAEAFFVRGCARLEMGEHDAAIADLSEAIDLNWLWRGKAFTKRADAYEAKGEATKARADRAEAKNWNPKGQDQ